MAAEIQIKRSGSTFDITQCNTILKEGELFYDLTSNLFYVGDGTSTLAQLNSNEKFAPSLESLGIALYDESVLKMVFDSSKKTSTIVAKSPKYSGNLTIPKRVFYNNEVYDVVAIGNSAFSSCTDLTSITISSNISSIGRSAFSDCTTLSSITFEAGSKISTIQYRTFYNCSSITSIVIPPNVTNIDESAFEGCSSLNTISFSTNGFLKRIGVSAFKDCTNLVSIEIPSTLLFVYPNAFSGCSGMTRVNFSNALSLVSIGPVAFQGCTSLTTLDIPSSVLTIGENAFSNCGGLTQLTINNYEDNISGKPWGASSSIVQYFPTKNYVNNAYNVSGTIDNVDIGDIFVQQSGQTTSVVNDAVYAQYTTLSTNRLLEIEDKATASDVGDTDLSPNVEVLVLPNIGGTQPASIPFYDPCFSFEVAFINSSINVECVYKIPPIRISYDYKTCYSFSLLLSGNITYRLILIFTPYVISGSKKGVYVKCANCTNAIPSYGTLVSDRFYGTQGMNLLIIEND